MRIPNKNILIILFSIIILFILLFFLYQSTNNRNIIFGVVGSTLNYSDMTILKSSSIRWMRFDVNLNNNSVEYIKNLTNNGFSILGILDYQTLGLELNGSGCIKNCNWTLNDWNLTVEKAVNEYPNIHIWEIWNEPQFSEFQSGFLANGNPYNYFLMLKSAYNIIKKNNPNDTVLCLGGNNIYEGTYTENDYLWAKELWSYGASNYCDAISLHAYSGFEYLLNQTPLNSAYNMSYIFNNELNLYENLTKKPIWITETGIPSNMNSSYPNFINATQQRQADFLNQTMNLFISKSYIRAVFWFDLKGSVDKPYNLDFGLFYNNMTKKLAFYTFNNTINRYS